MKNKEVDVVIKHYESNLGAIELLEFEPSKEMKFKPQLVLSRPNKYHDYNVVATLGMSDIKLKGIYSNCEFLILLDKNWKFKLDNINYNWPLDLLHKICNTICNQKLEVGYGKYIVNDDEKTYCRGTNMCTSVMCLPAMFDPRFFQLKMGKKYKNFFVITTATVDELNIIKHLGGINFVQRYLLPEGEDAFILRQK